MAVSQTQTVGVTAQSHTQAGERSNLMGANRTQALGITAFLKGSQYERCRRGNDLLLTGHE
jgi:hypothetical protein